MSGKNKTILFHLLFIQLFIHSFMSLFHIMNIYRVIIMYMVYHYEEFKDKPD